MDDSLQVGAVVAGRYELTVLIGKGALGSVWVGVDRNTGRKVVVKFIAKSQNFASEYYTHLLDLNTKFSGQPSPYVVLPLDLGEIEEYWYQILPYYENVVSLDQMMRQHGSMPLGKAMSLVTSIARALSDVHRASFIHSDLKPSNILVSEVPTLNVYLIDFGMALPLEAEQTVMLVATYRYLHPNLSAVTRAGDSSDRVRFTFASEMVGPYIDIYAMGVVALEMLTGKADLAYPVTENRVSSLITERSPSVAEINSSILQRTSNLIFQMLSVGPNRENISAQSVAALAESIVNETPKESSPLVATPIRSTGSADQTSSSGGTATLVRELRAIATKLAETTAALIAGAGNVKVASPEIDEDTLHEVDMLFGNARGAKGSSPLMAL